MLVRAEPERLYGGHPQLPGAANVLVESVTYEERVLGAHVERGERALEDRWVRFTRADLRGEDVEVQPLGEAHLLEVAVEQPARVEGVRDETEPQPALTEGVEQRVRRGAELSRGVPSGVLRLEKATELLVVDLDSEVAQEAAHETRVLDLLDCSRKPEEWFVVLAEVRRQRGHLWKV